MFNFPVTSPSLRLGATSSRETCSTYKVPKTKSGSGWLLPYTPPVLLMSFVNIPAFNSVRCFCSLYMAQTRTFNSESDASSSASLSISQTDQLGLWDKSRTLNKNRTNTGIVTLACAEGNVLPLTASDKTALDHSFASVKSYVHFTNRERYLLIDPFELNLRWKELRLGYC